MSMPALAVEGVSHFYGARKALDDVSFTIAPARFVALLGLNGAGKSTLFTLITRLYAVRSGRIRIFGHDVAREPGAALRLLGVVFQPRTLDLDLSVAQNLIYHAALHGIGNNDAHARAADVLAQIALADRAQDKVRDLSGGQMRRVEIARALLHRPRLLLLDEPTEGIQPSIVGEIQDVIGRLRARGNIAILLVEQFLDFALSAASYYYVMEKGHIVAEGDTRRISQTTVRQYLAV